jgi:UDP-N-acetylmuramate dehydrogenase
MHIETNKSLRAFNTFGIDATAKEFVSIKTTGQLKQLLAERSSEELFILGGGSNVLLTGDIDRLVVHIAIKGISVVSQNEHEVVLKVMAGENWHEFVLYCIERDFGGIENLSLIPGNTGTAPMQNIGAYGVELQDVFESCEAIEMSTGNIRTFSLEDCKFGYRNSIFKTEQKGKFVLSSVCIRLTKMEHRKNISYGAISEVLAAKGIVDPTIRDISDAVISIRNSKLPDPALLGNSGSFFKKTVLSTEEFQLFKLNFPDAPFYEVSATQFKIPAAWLIDRAGFKGKRYGDAGIHEKQALVLVNYGKASGLEIWELALQIQKKVKDEFDIFIEPEVNIV